MPTSTKLTSVALVGRHTLIDDRTVLADKWRLVHTLNNEGPTGISLADVDLSGANLQELDLRSLDLSGTDLSGATLAGADLAGSNLDASNLEGSSLFIGQSGECPAHECQFG